MLWSIDSSQNGVSRAQVSTHRGRVFFEVICWQVTSFQMIPGSSLMFSIHKKYVVFYMCCTIKILISNWPRKLRFSQFLQAGKTCQLLLTFLTKVTRWSRSTSNFYALIGQNLTGEFMRKIYAASWILFTLTAEADRVLCQLVMFLTVFFLWRYKMKYSCYQESSVIHGWFVYWVFGWEMRRLSKSEIRFRLASFSFFTLLDAGLKVSSDSGLNTVAFRSCISNGKPEELLYLMFGFFISNFMKSITVYAASLCGKFMHVCKIWQLRPWSDLVSGLI